jgi:3-dehydroquinate synthase
VVTVPVPVPAHRDASYDVVVGAGLLADAPSLLARHSPAAAYAVIADDTVAPLHAAPLVERLARAGRTARLFTFPAGEAAKTRATWATLTDALLAAGIGRDAAIVAVGGGVTGDVGGFVAATYLRGVPVVQVPTTLLAMVDASVGGKTAVDTPAGKNLVGAFHPPRLVVADIDTLRTLPAAVLADGLAEAAKHGVIADAEYLDFVAGAAPRVRAGDGTPLERLVARSVEIKTAVVAADPVDRGRRAILNYGHTVAHAVEAASGYAVPHGSAVAWGLVVEARAGERAGHTASGTATAVAAALAACGLDAAPHQPWPLARLLAAMQVDKKRRGDALHCALPARIGVMCGDDRRGWTLAVDRGIMARELVAAGIAVEA